MFKCKVCIEKDQRILELKEHIQYFKSVLNPPPRVSHFELEADNVLNGAGTEELRFPEPISEEAEKVEQEKLAAIQLEHDQMLSGTF